MMLGSLITQLQAVLLPLGRQVGRHLEFILQENQKTGAGIDLVKVTADGGIGRAHSQRKISFG